MPVRLVPGPLRPLADVPAYLRDRLGFFAGRGAAGSGPAVRCRLAGDGYLLTDPEDIRHVLVRNQGNYVKARRLAGPRATYPRPTSLLTSSGTDHRRRRRAMQPLFRRALAERVAARARANAERLAGSWSGGEVVDVTAATTAIAQRTILETLFGATSDERLEGLAEAVRARRRAIERYLFSIAPLRELVPSPVNLAHVRAVRRLEAAIEEEARARRARPEPADDLLAMLMRTTFDDGTTLTEDELRDEVLMIALTGYDSVSEALAWTLHLLADEPRRPDGGRLTAAVHESLRLFPPTWIFGRVALGHDTLPSGSHVPGAAKVYVSPYVVHRDPGLWPDPDRFDPERFAGGRENGRPRYAYFPFGGGSHVCIGETLAMAQIVAVLDALTARHRLVHAGSRAVEPEGGLTLRPKGPLLMRAEPRG
jgi:cytochrome P450